MFLFRIGFKYQTLLYVVKLCDIVVDEVKDVLAETSLSNNLIQIIQVNQGKLDPESQQLIKMASDLLILLLTGGRELDYSWTSVPQTLMSQISCICQSDLMAEPLIL